jgi:hypothetical protein
MTRDTHDIVGKASRAFAERINSCVEKNIVTLVTLGKLKMEPASLTELLNVLKQSVDEGYQLAYPHFIKDVKDATAAVKPTKR